MDFLELDLGSDLNPIIVERVNEFRVREMIECIGGGYEVKEVAEMLGTSSAWIRSALREYKELPYIPTVRIELEADDVVRLSYCYFLINQEKKVPGKKKARKDAIFDMRNYSANILLQSPDFFDFLSQKLEIIDLAIEM